MNYLLPTDCIYEFCRHTTDKTFVRLTQTCKDLNKLSKIRPMEDHYDLLITNFYKKFNFPNVVINNDYVAQDMLNGARSVILKKYSKKITYPDSIVKWELNYPLFVSSSPPVFPKSATYIKYSALELANISFPNNLKKLEIDTLCCKLELQISLKCLIVRMFSYSGTIKFSDNLTHLELGRYYRELIDDLPNSLAHLTLANNYIQPISKLPEALISLEIFESYPHKEKLLQISKKLPNLKIKFKYVSDGERFQNQIFADLGPRDPTDPPGPMGPPGVQGIPGPRSIQGRPGINFIAPDPTGDDAPDLIGDDNV